MHGAWSLLHTVLIFLITFWFRCFVLVAFGVWCIISNRILPSSIIQNEPQSGFDQFLQSAQSVLAEAIASGAAEKLLGGILGPNQNQGFSPQNAVSFSKIEINIISYLR